MTTATTTGQTNDAASPFDCPACGHWRYKPQPPNQLACTRCGHVYGDPNAEPAKPKPGRGRSSRTGGDTRLQAAVVEAIAALGGWATRADLAPLLEESADTPASKQAQLMSATTRLCASGVLERPFGTTSAASPGEAEARRKWFSAHRPDQRATSNQVWRLGRSASLDVLERASAAGRPEADPADVTALVEHLVRHLGEEVPAAGGTRPDTTLAELAAGTPEALQAVVDRVRVAPSEGWQQLAAAGRLDATLEAQLLTELGAKVCSDVDLRWARRRLADAGHDVAGDVGR